MIGLFGLTEPKNMYISTSHLLLVIQVQFSVKIQYFQDMLSSIILIIKINYK